LSVEHPGSFGAKIGGKLQAYDPRIPSLGYLLYPTILTECTMITSGIHLPSLVRLALLYLPLILILSGNHFVAAKKDNNLPLRRNSTGITSGLYWNDLSVQTSSGHYLLNPTHGFVGDGQVCGILGPSGAGKTTFLSSVGGTISSSSGLEIQGDILYYDADKQTREELQVQGGKVAWMQQKDSFFRLV
jgi:hypothetical protein